MKLGARSQVASPFLGWHPGPRDELTLRRCSSPSPDSSSHTLAYFVALLLPDDSVKTSSGFLVPRRKSLSSIPKSNSFFVLFPSFQNNKNRCSSRCVARMQSAILAPQQAHEINAVTRAITGGRAVISGAREGKGTKTPRTLPNDRVHSLCKVAFYI